MHTTELLRGDDPVVSTDGVTVFGSRLLDEAVFEVRPPKVLKAPCSDQTHIGYILQHIVTRPSDIDI